MEKTIILAEAAAVGDRAVYDGSYACKVGRCRNLRPVNGRDGSAMLATVGRPAFMAQGSYEPMGELSGVDGRSYLVLRHGRQVYRIDANDVNNGSDGSDRRCEPEYCGELGGDYVSCVACGGELLVSTSRGMVTIALRDNSDGKSPLELRQACGAEFFHGLSLGSASHTILTERVGPRRLSRVYDATETMPDSGDLANMSNDYLAAYSNLCTQAMNRGCLVQPVLVRYVVYDSAMNELFASAPVLLSGPGGTQALQAAGIRSTDRRNLESYDLQVSAWRIVLQAPMADLPAGAAVVAVKVSPQFHPLDAGRQASVNLLRSGSGDFARVSLPSTATAITADNEAGARSRIMAAVSRFDSLEYVAAYIPVSRLEATVEIESGTGMMLSQEQSVLETALSRPVRATETGSGLFRAPNQFIAGCGAAGPTAVLWGGLRLRRYGGYPAAMFATSYAAATSWSSWVRIDFADGSSVVTHDSGSGTTPRQFNPLLSYPSSDAVKMTIGLKVSGQTAREQSFSLQSDESLGRSVYIHPTFLPFELAVSASAVMPPEQACEYDYSDWLAVASAETPGQLVAGLRTGNVKVKAIVAAAGSQSAWDFGRPRFYALGYGGVLSVSVNAGLNTIAASTIDRRSLTSPGALTAIDGQCWAVLGGDLVRLQAQRAVTVRAACGYSAIVWLGQKRELAGLLADGSIEHTAFDYGMVRFVTDYDYGEATGLYDMNGRPLAGYATGLYDLGREAGAGTEAGMKPLTVQWVADISHRRGHAIRPAAVFADMTAAGLSATLSVHRATPGRVATEPDFGLTFDGELRSAAGCRMLTRPAPGWQLRLIGRAAGLVFRAIHLKC